LDCFFWSKFRYQALDPGPYAVDFLVVAGGGGGGSTYHGAEEVLEDIEHQLNQLV